MMDKIIQIGQICDSKGFDNPQIGRIYSIFGVSPVIDTMGGEIVNLK